VATSLDEDYNSVFTFVVTRAGLLAIRATQLKDLLTGDEVAPAKAIVITNIDKSSTTMTNLAYASWVARDQSVLSHLLSSLTREMLLHVMCCTTVAQACSTLANLYSS
jgi:ABC-type xylose transport system permease subunit